MIAVGVDVSKSKSTVAIYLLPHSIIKKQSCVNLPLELIEIPLVSNLSVLHAVIGLFGPHVQNQPYGKKVEITYSDPDLRAAQKEQRRGHLPFTSASPFFASTSVSKLSPHNSRICGST